jgi:hypothetical protein
VSKRSGEEVWQEGVVIDKQKRGKDEVWTEGLASNKQKRGKMNSGQRAL